MSHLQQKATPSRSRASACTTYTYKSLFDNTNMQYYGPSNGFLYFGIHVRWCSTPHAYRSDKGSWALFILRMLSRACTPTPTQVVWLTTVTPTTPCCGRFSCQSLASSSCPVVSVVASPYLNGCFSNELSVVINWFF